MHHHSYDTTGLVVFRRRCYASAVDCVREVPSDLGCLLVLSFSRNGWEFTRGGRRAPFSLSPIEQRIPVPTPTRVYYISPRYDEHPSIRRHTPHAQVLLLPHTRTL